MIGNKRVYAIIPARAGSKRLKKKNIKLLNGRPLLSYAINACKASIYIDEIYVSTESKDIAKIAEEYGSKILKRPQELAEDNVSTQDVMKHFAESFAEFEILVLVQANSPQIKPQSIDKGLELMEKNNLWEVRSVNFEGLENGAFWITKRKTIFWNSLSVYFGVVQDNAIDIHDEEDLEEVEAQMSNGN